jgi:ribonuclease HI
MKITIFTDISRSSNFYKNYNGGYSFVTFSKFGSDAFYSPTVFNKNTNIAEMFSMIDAIIFVLENQHYYQASEIIIYNDSLTAIRTLRKLYKNNVKKPKHFEIYLINFFKKIKNQISISFQHVKGHNGGTTKASFINLFVDNLSRRAIKNPESINWEEIKQNNKKLRKYKFKKNIQIFKINKNLTKNL